MDSLLCTADSIIDFFMFRGCLASFIMPIWALFAVQCWLFLSDFFFACHRNCPVWSCFVLYPPLCNPQFVVFHHLYRLSSTRVRPYCSQTTPLARTLPECVSDIFSPLDSILFHSVSIIYIFIYHHPNPKD